MPLPSTWRFLFSSPSPSRDVNQGMVTQLRRGDCVGVGEEVSRSVDCKSAAVK